MATLRTSPWACTEPARVARTCVWARGGAPHAELSPQALCWPSFHSGVATALCLVPLVPTSIDTAFVLYNKPRGTAEMSSEHAGFLMGLGLNGHLRDMPFMNIYEYLVKCNEMISIGLLLGLAATYRGTMDVQATKMLSIHLEPLLPPTSVELDIQQNILVAALMGVGLLYQGTAHAHYTQVLLNEIGKPPGPEAESCVEREGYALAAGLALGLVCAGAWRDVPRRVPHALRTYMLGGDRPAAHGGQRERCKPGVNLDVTSPGGTVALGLLYLRAGRRAPAAWLQPPDTAYQLDYVRPDLLMLRVIARGLMLWDSIEASEEWIEDQVPETIKPYCFVKPTEDNIDYEAMNQAYCNIVAGAAFALGLRFAGSGDADARDAVLHHARALAALADTALAELAGRSTLEYTLCVCLLAAGMIMAGRGDLSLLRMCRRLRARVPAPGAAAPPLTHGGQMAIHCTIGLLFLGGGRCTLSTTPTAVAALLAAFFPKFPTHSEDNRYHLQALRHLYVLAVEPRLLLPRDIDTGELCYAHIQVIDLQGSVRQMKAPCILPELDKLKEVKIDDPRYWPITFQRDRNWDQLKLFLEYTWCVEVKQRAGCLPHRHDPHGFLTMLAQSLTLDKANTWSIITQNIELFTNDDKIRSFAKRYLWAEAARGCGECGECVPAQRRRRGGRGEPRLWRPCECRRYSKDEQDYVQALNMVTYECVVKDILCALPIWTTFLKIIKTMKTDPSAYHTWQMKLLLSQVEQLDKRSTAEMKVDGLEAHSEPLVSAEFTLAIKQKVALAFDAFELRLTPYLRKYVGLPSSRDFNNCEPLLKKALSAFLVYHDIKRGELRGCAGEEGGALVLAGGAGGAEGAARLGALLR
ncbi:anaphase-promoting complex subunit 1-like isoform X2 [Bombyx mandarina]|uniref:Anaphase-promoting complex subunit 1-like isoform X1 n=1 Tax=Bombyx mandarina TaxID=7092 RepID=A0A6J2KA58_BOMMA|nr:anaphase-promoting complex subunit 1-like isoform X1 [Bombyx mandarina]XP_028037200.1 anaphase-promoting complex subunit 1-like isoform X2 [Bombyx mandarina]